ncbi:MAG TPA: J domain-containing protein [Candidatus Limnocylindria bacterium]|nr:J domain-containing protein [Candidatus Limnocylindria bacterium]
MAHSSDFDPYRVLGVPRAATLHEIGRAHRRLAKETHPDLHGPDAAARMRAINRAWHLLSDPKRREAWDRAHASGGVAGHWPAPQPGDAAREPSWQPGPTATWSEPWTSPAPARGPTAERSAPATPSVRDSGWLAAGVGLALVVAAILLASVAATSRPPTSLDQAMAEAGLRMGNTVALDSTNALVIREPAPGEVEAAHFYQRPDGSWQEGQRTRVAPSGDNTVSVMAWDGVGRSPAWRTFVFGRSAPGVDRVVLPDRALGTETFDGTWGIGLPDGALTVSALRWEFLAADGSVVIAGSGQLGG